MKVNIKNWPKTGHRKISVEIEGFDTWDLDSTLAKIIYPALLQLKERSNSVPNELTKDIGGEDYADQSSFDFYKETYNEAFSEVCKRWDEILNKIIWSFQQLAMEEYDKKYHHGVGEYEWVETSTLYPNPITGKMEKTYQMVDKNPDEHWYDHAGHMLHEKRIQEGLELFGKYYRNLWD
jgi:hypothetical protein